MLTTHASGYDNNNERDWIPEKYRGKLFLTVNDLKDIMGIGLNGAYEFAKSGKVRSEMISRKLRINAKSFWDWYEGESNNV